MKRAVLVMCAAILLMTVAAVETTSANPCDPVMKTCAPPMREIEVTVRKPVIVEKQITCYETRKVVDMVPRTRKVREWVCETEMVPETRIVCEPVQKTKMVECTRTVIDRELVTEEKEITVCKPVWRTETKQCTIMVPKQETRQGTRTRCVMKPVTKTKTVCEDKGEWVVRTIEPPTPKACTPVAACKPACAPPACAPVAQPCTVREWVPNIVKTEVPYTCMVPTNVTEPCEYTVTVCEPQVVTREYQVCDMVPHKEMRQFSHYVCKPRTITETVPVTTCEMVRREVTCMVPKINRKLVCREVTEMCPVTRCERVPVTKTIRSVEIQPTTVKKMVPCRRPRVCAPPTACDVPAPCDPACM